MISDIIIISVWDTKPVQFEVRIQPETTTPETTYVIQDSETIVICTASLLRIWNWYALVSTSSF